MPFETSTAKLRTAGSVASRRVPCAWLTLVREGDQVLLV